MKLIESFLELKRGITLGVTSLLFIFFSGIILCKASNIPSIRMGYLQADLHQLSGYIAIEKKLYEKQGLNVKVAGVFKAGPEEMTAFAANEIDFGFVGVAPATVSVANKTANVNVIAQANNLGSAIVVRKDLPIGKLKDLVGRVVVIPGHSTVQDVLLRKALIKEEVSFKDLKIMVMKPPEMLGAMRTKQIDAYIAWEPFVSMGIIEGLGKVLLTSNEIWPNHPCCVLIAQSEFVSKDKEAIRKILKAHVEAIHFIKEQPDKAIGIAIKYTGVNRDTVLRAMRFIDFTYEPNVDGVTEYIRLLNQLGYVNIEDPKKFVSAFINGSFLKEILFK